MIEMGPTYTKRYEKKFITSKNKINQYILENKSFLSYQFTADHFLKSSTYTNINNIYFDDENLTSYLDSIHKKKYRQKIRARTYAENGVESNLIFLEIKRKEDGLTTKNRISLKKSWYNEFVFHGKISIVKLLKLNSATPKEEVLKTIETLSEFIHKKNYRPMLINHYRRQAYKFKKDHKLRLTIDSNLTYELIGYVAGPNVSYPNKLSKNDVIIEAKYKNKELYEIEMADLKKNILGTSLSFSKYCYCISQAYCKTVKSTRIEDINLISESIRNTVSIEGATLKNEIHSLI